MKKMIEIHVLQNFAPSNLNRDDTGAPKDAIFGGVRRARVSSQCSKRAVRGRFNEMVANGVFGRDDLAVRTKRVLDALTERLVSMGRQADEASAKVRSAMAAVKLSIEEDGKSQYLLFLGEREITKITGIVNEKWDSIAEIVEDDESDDQSANKKSKNAKKAKKAKAKGADPELKKALLNVLDGGKAVDLALFGRTLTDMPEKNQYAACQVAHAISTHAVEREFDFYTAVDDLKPEDNAGADMLGTVEFNSACYYRYAMIDWEKLVENLQGDTELATKGVQAFMDGFVLSEPTGKQNTFAAHNPPEFVAITVRRSGDARNLANAFEVPVFARRGESITGRSAEALIKKAQALQACYGGDSDTFVLNLTNASVDGLGQVMTTLNELLVAVMASVKG